MRSFQITVFDAPLTKAEAPTPVPQGREVLLKMRAAGVCHSDLHVCEGHYDLGGGKKLRMADRGVGLPIVLGHEIVGEVIAAGPDAGPVEIGSVRVVYPWIGCGECAVCERGDEHHCPKPRFLGIYKFGGYASHVIVPDAKYLFDIGKMKPEIAAPYACSGLTTYSALNKINPAVLKSEPILVIGAGGLGLMCLSLMKLLGAKGAIVADIDPAKRAAAKEAGALAVIDSAAPDALDQIRKAAGLPGMRAVIDLVGAPATVQLAVDSVVKGGHIVIVGLIGGEITLPIPYIPQRAMTIQGSYTGSPGEMAELMELVKNADVQVIPTHTRPLDEANEAMNALRSGKVIGRTVLVD